MRIVVNGWFWNRLETGSGQYLRALAAAFPRARSADDLMMVRPSVFGEQSESPLGWQVIFAGTPFDRMNQNLTKIWFEQVTFPRICKGQRASVGFVPYWGSPWWRPCPTVVTVHDLIPLLLPAYRGGITQRGYTWLVAQTARRASAVMTDSEASRQDIMRHLRLPAGRIFVSYLGVDACPDVADHAAREVEVRARYVLPSGAFLLYLGGSDPRKNLSRTIEGYGRMVERSRIDGIQPPALVIAGKPSRSGGLLAEDPHPVIERLGLRDHVRFIGWVDEKDKFVLYRLATGVLFLSEYEGFGLPVLEAMACEAGYPG